MSTVDFGNPDVIVIGAGNAACCAALAARESGANVIMLEAAPLDDCGGNSRYTAGAVRIVFNGVDDLAQLIPTSRTTRRRPTITAPTPRTSTSTTWAASPITAPIPICARS